MEYIGAVNGVHEAFVLLEAARVGYIRTFKNRPSVSERNRIGAGTVIMFDETETGMTRWIDGKSWSPSRFRDGFFIYQEVSKPRSNFPEERSYTGLCKKAISVASPDGHHHHLISYYNSEYSSGNSSVLGLISQHPQADNIFMEAEKYRYFKCFRTRSLSWRRPYPAPKKGAKKSNLTSQAACLSPEPIHFDSPPAISSSVCSSLTSSLDSYRRSLISSSISSQSSKLLPPISSVLALYPNIPEPYKALPKFTTNNVRAEDQRQLSLISRFMLL